MNRGPSLGTGGPAQLQGEAHWPQGPGLQASKLPGELHLSWPTPLSFPSGLLSECLSVSHEPGSVGASCLQAKDPSLPLGCLQTDAWGHKC